MIVGFIAILFMGITLGLLGAGGSILTVPILVYLFEINPILSTSYSLLLVGFIALFGNFFYFKKQQVDFNIAIKFAIPSIISVYLTRRFVLPMIPNNFMIFNIPIEKDLFILFLFAGIMLLSSLAMIKGSHKILTKNNEFTVNSTFKNIFILIESTVVGFITAMIGAGGGFLIVPALVLLNKIDIKVAIGSSLFIIATKSLIGFIGDIQSGITIDYSLSFTLLSLAIIGMLFGITLNKHMNSSYLKKGFGYFVMLTSILIIVKEVVL